MPKKGDLNINGIKDILKQEKTNLIARYHISELGVLVPLFEMSSIKIRMSIS